jgi:hypothetical protein
MLKGKNRMERPAMYTAAFEPEPTARDAARLMRELFDQILNRAGEALITVDPSMKQFGREEIRLELGNDAPKMLRTYDAFIELIGEVWLDPDRFSQLSRQQRYGLVRR